MTRRPRRMVLAGRTALVTGAAGGIGRGIALALAARGVHVALADIDVEGLAGTAALLSATRVRVSRHALDVADAAAVAAAPVAVSAEHPALDILVNNAGVALGGSFEQLDDADFEWLFAVNFRGVVRMTRAFLPLLRRSDDARLVNLSSLYGLIAPPGQTAYAASKFAVRGFSEALRHELAGTTVGVSTVHPGGVATAIARSARLAAGLSPGQADALLAGAERLLTLPPERAGTIIAEGIVRRRPRILVGRDARAVALIERLAPVGHWPLLRRLGA